MAQESLESWTDEGDGLPETCLSFELRGEWGSLSTG